MRIVLPNNRGVTLVEVMISLAILLVVFMGMIQASLLSINHNMRNEIRDEAVRVAAESMTRLRSFNYACDELDDTAGSFVTLINGGYANCGYDPADPTFVATLPEVRTPTRHFRNLSRTYRVAKEVQTLNTNTKRLAVRVRWLYPDEDPLLPEDQWNEHTINYMMRNPAQ